MRYFTKLFGLVALTVLMVPVGQLSGLSQEVESLEQVQNSNALVQGEHAEDLIAEAYRLFNEFDQLWRMSQYQAAQEKLQQALELYRNSSVRQAFPQASRQGEAGALNGLGVMAQNVGQYEQALNYYQEALLISQDIGDRTVEAATLNNIGEVNRLSGNYPTALEYYEQSLAIARKVGDRTVESQPLNNIGEVNQLLGNYLTALEYYEQSLVIQRDIGDRAGEARTLGRIGIVKLLLGNHLTALEYYEQSLVIQRDIGERAGEAGTLNSIGIVNDLFGNYPTALEYYEQSLAIHREIGDRAGEAATLNNIGNVYNILGNYPTALEYYQQSLAIQQEIGDRQGKARTLNNIGEVNIWLGNYSTALDYHQQSLVIQRDIGDRAGEAGTLHNIGIVNRLLGDYPAALEHYEQSLVIQREIGDRTDEARTLGNIGVVNGSLGNYPTALEYYQQSLAIQQEIGDRAGEAQTLGSIGLLLNVQSQPEVAITFLKEAINKYEVIRNSNRALDSNLQESYTVTIGNYYRILAELLLRQDRILEAQEVLDLLKLQELDDYLRDIRRSSDTPVQQLDFWPAEQAILDLYNQQLQANSSFSFTDFINSTAVTQQVEQLRRTAQGQNLNPDQLARLQDNLQQAGNAALLYPLILDDKIELVLVTTSGLIRETVPVDRVELNRAITAFRTDITDPRSNPTANAQKLYQWLIAPIAQQLAQAEVDTILYAADGTLRYIPLAALHDGEQWLTQQYTINHITAASLTDFRRDRTTNLNILAGAFPADTGYSVEINGESRFYQGLPAAKAEVETIQADIPSTNALFDQQFNPAAVVPQLSDYSIVHFATHAQFVSGFPHESFILFGNGERVTLRDIGEWSLPNAELVVLSACETAVSEGLGNGEEILGFGYQMQRIGVEAAIASLWQVNDGGTQVLMNRFYSMLQQGHSKVEALQQAQTALIEGDLSASELERAGVTIVSDRRSTSTGSNLSHPYYWAPFILIGNGL